MAAKNLNTCSLQRELFGITGAGDAKGENVSQGRIEKVRGVGDPLGTGLCSQSLCCASLGGYHRPSLGLGALHRGVLPVQGAPYEHPLRVSGRHWLRVSLGWGSSSKSR